MRFSPNAWAKLLFLRDYGETEVGGFGVTDSDDLLFVREFDLVEQLCTEVTVSFTDEAVADFFDRQVDLGRQPEQFARIWVHTHPGDDPHPSITDEETFERVFGDCDWAVMAIVARRGEAYARLHWRQAELTVPLEMTVDYSRPFEGTDFAAWETEYQECVHEEANIWCSVADDDEEDDLWQAGIRQDIFDLEVS